MRHAGRSASQIDRDRTRSCASAIFSWREKEFAAAYADKAPAAVRRPAARSSGPILAFVEPKLLATEKEFLEKNTFQVAFMPFDWTLNDLTGRGGR